MGHPDGVSRGLRTAVVGHVEWTTIARLARVPQQGEVAHAAAVWEGPAGGGAVAAVQMAQLTGRTTFFTALGDDTAGRRTEEVLGRLGVEVLTAARPGRTRTAVSVVDDSGERTTTTLGPRLQPSLDDPLPWNELVSYDVVHFVAGDGRVLEHARRARVVTASLRESEVVATCGVPVDALIGSAADPAERYDPASFTTEPGLVVLTEGREGGRFLSADGTGRYDAVPVPGQEQDSYGMGDNFAAALAYALGRGDTTASALRAAAERAARCAATRGPYTLP